MKTTMEMCNQTGSSSKPARRKQVSGFTLIELVIVLAIVAIGVALAVPTFRSITEKRQLTGAAESVASLMSFAQSAAVKYNRDVSVNIRRTDFDTWCVGATLGTTACDCSEVNVAAAGFCDINGVPRRIEHADVVSNPAYQLMLAMSIDGTVTANSNFTFDPVRGTLLNLETVNIQMHTNTGIGISKEYQLEVDVLPTGRVSICTATGRKLLLRQYPTCS
jgi:prepilin-type N-terminal cleavage/methylation domain-containing protein